MKKLIYLPFLLLFAMCQSGSKEASTENKEKDSVKLKINTLNFKLNKDLNGRKGKVIFKKGDYNLVFQNAYVKSGSYSGLELIFKTKESENDFTQLRFELPSAKTLIISYENGVIKTKIPRTPFVLTEKDFQGVKNSRYGREQPAYVELSHFSRLPDGNFESPSVVFTVFFFNFTKAVFGKTDITMKSTFSAETDSQFEMMAPKGMRIDGAFKIVKQPCLNKKVD